jgi:hypothetical protein
MISEILYKIYTKLNIYLNEGVYEKIFRHLIYFTDRLESRVYKKALLVKNIVRNIIILNNESETKKTNKSFIAIYNLKKYGITFDILTFLGTLELLRISQGVTHCHVVVFAPKIFPIYQWQKRKVFSGGSNLPLIASTQEEILRYLLRLTDCVRIFSGSITVEIITNITELERRYALYERIYADKTIASEAVSEVTPEFRYFSLMKHSSAKYEYQLFPIAKNFRLASKLSRDHFNNRIPVTVNIRNQNYSRGRNFDTTNWLNFFKNKFISDNFVFIIFNDAENPIKFPPIHSILYCDNYIGDNFRRMKVILKIGMHIGSASGSSAVVTLSDIPYLLVGEMNEAEQRAHLDPDIGLKFGRHTYLNKFAPHQIFVEDASNLLSDFRKLIASSQKIESIFSRYTPENREKLIELLNIWPAD